MGSYTPPPGRQQMPNIYSPQRPTSVTTEPSPVSGWVKLIAIYVVINVVLYAVQRPRAARNTAELEKLIPQLEKDKERINRSQRLLDRSNSSLSTPPPPSQQPVWKWGDPQPVKTNNAAATTYAYNVSSHNAGVDAVNKRVDRYNKRLEEAKRLARGTRIWLVFPIPLKPAVARNLK